MMGLGFRVGFVLMAAESSRSPKKIGSLKGVI